VSCCEYRANKDASQADKTMIDGVVTDPWNNVGQSPLMETGTDDSHIIDEKSISLSARIK